MSYWNILLAYVRVGMYGLVLHFGLLLGLVLRYYSRRRFTKYIEIIFVLNETYYGKINRKINHVLNSLEFDLSESQYFLNMANSPQFSLIKNKVSMIKNSMMAPITDAAMITPRLIRAWCALMYCSVSYFYNKILQLNKFQQKNLKRFRFSYQFIQLYILQNY